MIVYQRMDLSHVSQAMRLLEEVFRTEEPITRHLQVAKEEFAPFAKDLLQHAIEYGFVWMAYDLKVRELVGIRVATRGDHDFTPKKDYGEKMRQIVLFLESLSKGQYKHPPSEVIHTHMVCVNKEYSGQGIGKSLLRCVSKDARNNGLKWSTGEATNRRSIKILEEIPSFEILNRRKYSEYSSEEMRLFSNLRNHDEAVHYQFDLRDAAING